MTPNNIIIVSWKSTGLRSPDHFVSFEDENGHDYPISLIQMPNGTGKTTTLTMLRAVISGDAQSWKGERVREFQKKSGPDTGSFEVQLRLDGKRYSFTARFDFEEGSVQFYTTTPSVGQRLGYHPPNDFHAYLNKSVINYYIFDGELAQHLLDQERSNAESIINNMYRLSLFDLFALDIDRYWQKSISASSAKTDRGYARRANKVKNLEDRITFLKKEKSRDESEQSSLTQDLATLQRDYSDAIDASEKKKVRLETLAARLAVTAADMQNASKDLFEAVKSPLNITPYFSEILLDFKNGLDKVKLPESAAREFFEEICNEDYCICGRALDDSVRETIRSRAERYLGSDEMTLLNSLKESISSAHASQAEMRIKTMAQKRFALNDAISKYKKAKYDYDELHIAFANEDPEIDKILKSITELEKKAQKVNDNLKKYDNIIAGPTIDTTYGICTLEKQLIDARKDLDEAIEIKTINRKRDILKEIAERAKELARSAITARLTEETNEKIRTILPDNDVKLQSIERCLKLEGQAGGSQGEQLSIAYAFLSTIFAGAACRVPFVVDSPAGSIDLDVRPRIGELVPKLGGQFIAFIISSERAGFIPAIIRTAASPINYVTICKKSYYEAKGYSPDVHGIAISHDGVCILGKDFFESFHDGDDE